MFIVHWLGVWFRISVLRQDLDVWSSHSLEHCWCEKRRILVKYVLALQAFSGKDIHHLCSCFVVQSK